jgi:hypothetical protein
LEYGFIAGAFALFEQASLDPPPSRRLTTGCVAVEGHRNFEGLGA